jgi:hypothetical protein
VEYECGNEKFECGILSVGNGKFEFKKSLIVDPLFSKNIYFCVTTILDSKNTMHTWCIHASNDAYMYEVLEFSREINRTNTHFL